MKNSQVNEMLQQLLQNNLVYRYHPERFKALTGKGYPYPSPTRIIETSAGQMVEEVIQPVLEPVKFTPEQLSQLKAVARAWPKLLAAQLEIFRLAKTGQLNPPDTELIKSLCTEEEWDKGLTDPGYQTIHPFIRLDAVLVGDCFKVMDINSTRPAGAGDLMNFQAACGDDFGLCPDIGSSFASIIKQCVDEWCSDKNLPGESTPFKVVTRPTDGDWHNFQTLYKCLLGSGFNAEMIGPDQLNCEPSAVLRSRIKEGDPAFNILKENYPQNRCVLSPLFRRFLGNKVWMYLYRLEQFSPIFREYLQDDYQVLDDVFVPIGLVESGFVNFPNGQGNIALSELERRMYLGLTMGKKKWQDAMETISSGSIVQQVYKVVEERLVADAEVGTKTIKLFSKYGIYIFGSKLAGAEFHARKSPVVHGARDAYFNSVCFN